MKDIGMFGRIKERIRRGQANDKKKRMYARQQLPTTPSPEADGLAGAVQYYVQSARYLSALAGD
jgi:hypothetical protein